MVGDGAWETPDVVLCEDPNDPDCTIAPTEDEECVYLFSECNFLGTQTKVCDNTPFTDIDYEVLSIIVPDDSCVYLYNLPCFNGMNAEVCETKDCFTDIGGLEFTNFLDLGIKLVDTKTLMKRSPGSKQVRYRTNELKKATKKLATYKRKV